VLHKVTHEQLKLSKLEDGLCKVFAAKLCQESIRKASNACSVGELSVAGNTINHAHIRLQIRHMLLVTSGMHIWALQFA